MIPKIPVEDPNELTWGWIAIEKAFPMTPESKNKIGIFFDVKKISKYEVQMMIIIEFIKTCPKSRCKNKEVISL